MVHSHRDIAETKVKIFFDVCYIFFKKFRFLSAWMGTKVGDIIFTFCSV